MRDNKTVVQFRKTMGPLHHRYERESQRGLTQTIRGEEIAQFIVFVELVESLLLIPS